MIKLDFFPFNYYSPETNMEIDNSFLSLKDGFFFRLYGWKPYGVSIGFSQEKERVCNIDYCEKKGIKIVKRITGGGAVYHKNDITYMFSAPLDFFKEKSVIGVYREVAEILMEIFKTLGLNCSFAGSIEKNIRKEGMRKGIPCFLLPSDYEIIVDGKKVVGNALRIGRDRVLQHGSIAFDFDYEETAIILDTSIERLSNRVISLKELLPSLTIEDFEYFCIKCLKKYGFCVNIAKKPLPLKE